MWVLLILLSCFSLGFAQITCYHESSLTELREMDCQYGCVYTSYHVYGRGDSCMPDITRMNTSSVWCFKDPLPAPGDPDILCYCKTDYCNTAEKMNPHIHRMNVGAIVPGKAAGSVSGSIAFIVVFSLILAL